MFFFSGFKMSFAFFFSERALENPWSGEVSPAPGVLVDCAWFTRSPQAPSLPSGSDLPSQSCGWAGLGVGLAQTLASAMPAQVSSPGLALSSPQAVWRPHSEHSTSCPLQAVQAKRVAPRPTCKDRTRASGDSAWCTALTWGSVTAPRASPSEPLHHLLP